MVLGKLSVLGRPTYLGYSKARSFCACNRCGWGCFDILSFPFSFSLFGRRPDIDENSVSKGR